MFEQGGGVVMHGRGGVEEDPGRRDGGWLLCGKLWLSQLHERCGRC